MERHKKETLVNPKLKTRTKFINLVKNICWHNRKQFNSTELNVQNAQPAML